MSKIDKSLSELFGVDPLYDPANQTNTLATVQIVDPEQRAIEVINDPDSSDMEQDVAMIRNNMHAMIREGQEAFSALIHIAKAEERISAFEVCNSYLANLTEMNMQLMTLHEKKKKLKMMSSDKSSGAIVNNGGTTNIAFVGTTKEMLEHIKKSKSE
jgi:hypothetical protein